MVLFNRGDIKMDKLEVAIDNLVQTNAKFDKTLNGLVRSVQWLSIISLIYYITTVLWIGSKFV